MADLPILEFLTDRVKEFNPNFELRKGTAYEQLFFKPLQFMMQPLRDEANEMYVSQSFLRILSTDDPDSYSEDAVDSLASNLYVERRQGAKSSGVARLYYNDPDTFEYPATGLVGIGANGQRYTNPAPFIIEKVDMNLQIEQGLYYFDIPLESEESGAATALEINELVSIENDTRIVRVTNLTPFSGGLDRETNTEFISRIRQSIAVRDLVTGKGFNATLFENFQNFLLEAVAVGFGDKEMMRDVVYNTHIGGRVDGYVKTSKITQGQSDFIGLRVDTTRQTYTSRNCQMLGTAWTFLGNTNVDRSNGKTPTVVELKISENAEYLSPVSFLTPIDLSFNQYVKISIDGVVKNVRVAGGIPSSTVRNEVVSLINFAFGLNVAFPSGDSFVLRSPTSGINSQIILDHPDFGGSALTLVFGLNSMTELKGDGPVTFIEGMDYEWQDMEGRLRRILGPIVVPTSVTGQTTLDSTSFIDSTPNAFLAVQPRDVITINTGGDIGDYRVLTKSSNNEIVLDKAMTSDDLAVSYEVRRTGIKNGETVYATYYFNPVSVDVGRFIKLDQYGQNRGIRPGREAFTLTDLPLLRINFIEEIDALTGEPTGYTLDGQGGFGQGGFGKGGFGIGQGQDWYLAINSPTERFSMFEDSYIVLRSGFQGLSIRVHYDYVPEVESIHNFVRSSSERVLDGDILIKHFLPAYVDGVIRYSIDESNSVAPDNDTLTNVVKDYINKLPSNTSIEYSDIIQVMLRALDPFDRYSGFIRPFTLNATIHNTDGSTTKTTGIDELKVPVVEPFPVFTKRPLSPRIVHWIADNIVLERL